MRFYVSFAILFILLLFLGRKTLVEKGLYYLLSQNQLEKLVTYEVAEVGLTGIELKKLSFGTAASVERFRIEVSPSSLIQGLPSYVQVDGGLFSPQTTMIQWQTREPVDPGADPFPLLATLGKGKRADDGFELDGIHGKVQFDSLLPPSTLPKQTIEIDFLRTPWLTLHQGELLFQLESERKLFVESISWRLGEGEISAKEIPIQLDHLDRTAFVIEVNGVSFLDLLPDQSESFYATGKLQGRIPVRLDEKGAPLFETGSLHTLEGGIIRYNPPRPPSQEWHPKMQLVLELLKNFHYQSVEFLLNSKTAELVEVQVALKGANPEVEKGRVVHLNINLKGNFLQTLKHGIKLYDLPEAVIEKIQ